MCAELSSHTYICIFTYMQLCVCVCVLMASQRNHVSYEGD